MGFKLIRDFQSPISNLPIPLSFKSAYVFALSVFAAIEVQTG